MTLAAAVNVTGAEVWIPLQLSLSSWLHTRQALSNSVESRGSLLTNRYHVVVLNALAFWFQAITTLLTTTVKSVVP